MPDAFCAERNCLISSSGRGGANHCLLFFTKIWAAVNPSACARGTDCETPPLMEVCAPRSTPAGRWSDSIFPASLFLDVAVGLAFAFGFVAALAGDEAFLVFILFPV